VNDVEDLVEGVSAGARNGASGLSDGLDLSLLSLEDNESLLDLNNLGLASLNLDDESGGRLDSKLLLESDESDFSLVESLLATSDLDGISVDNDGSLGGDRLDLDESLDVVSSGGLDGSDSVELLSSGVSELNSVALQDSSESLASASLAFNDDDSLLSGLASLDNDLSSLDNLLLGLDKLGDGSVASNSDSLLSSKDVSLSLLDSGELDSESLDLGRAAASLESVLNLGSLDLLLSDLGSNLDLGLELSDFSLDLSGFSSNSSSFSLQDLGDLVATALLTSNSDDNGLLGSLADLDESLDSLDLELLLSESHLVSSNGGSVDLARVSLGNSSPSLDGLLSATASLSLDDDLTGLLADSDSLLDLSSVNSDLVNSSLGSDLSELNAGLSGLELPCLDLSLSAST